MNVVRDEGRAQASSNHVRCYHKRDEETSGIDVHSCQRRDDLAASEDETCADKHVRREAVEEVGQVCNSAMSGEDNLGECVGLSDNQ